MNGYLGKAAFVIAMIFIITYAYLSIMTDKNLSDLQNIVMIIVGYYFGSSHGRDNKPEEVMPIEESPPKVEEEVR